MDLPAPIRFLPLLVVTLLASGCAAFAEYGSDTGMGLGVRGNAPLDRVIPGETGDGALSRMEGAASLHRFWMDNGAYTEANLDVLVPLLRLGDGAARSYAGGGLHLGRFSPDVGNNDTKLGLNLIGGVRFERRAFAPFFELRGSVGGSDQLSGVVGVQLTGGLF